MLQKNFSPHFQQTYILPEGDLRCTFSSCTADFSHHDLFAVVSRNNPNRQFLFASKILCRHIPASPAKLTKACKLLAKQLPKSCTPTLFVGFAETATALGALLWREAHLSNSLYLCTTRFTFDRPKLATTVERHSHAPNHILYMPEYDLTQCRWNLVFIDDEYTTSRTAETLCEQICAKIDVEQVSYVSILDWSNKKNHFSLCSGSCSFFANSQKSHPFPNPPKEKQSTRIPPLGNWGRTGMRSMPQSFSISFQPSERILCIGCGEYCLDAFLIAEQAEHAGAKALCCATTRSPIRLGNDITHVFCLENEFGLPYHEYLYNVDPNEYDRILVFSETGHVDPKLNDLLDHKVEFYVEP